jgi:hypothetical protein
MATVLFVVKDTITKDREAAFNRWYDGEHVPARFALRAGVPVAR